MFFLSISKSVFFLICNYFDKTRFCTSHKIIIRPLIKISESFKKILEVSLISPRCFKDLWCLPTSFHIHHHTCGLP